METKESDQVERFLPVMFAWDDMDSAAQRVLTAQPFQMTEAADRLDKARLAMRTAVQRHGRQLQGIEP